MAKTTPRGLSPIGPAAYTKDDPARNKPSWFSLGGYFSKKGRGKQGQKSPSSAQQKSNKGDRGKR